jgi:hypothetical protein
MMANAKKRQQLERAGAPARHIRTDTAGVAREILEREGPAGFWRGQSGGWGARRCHGCIMGPGRGRGGWHPTQRPALPPIAPPPPPMQRTPRPHRPPLHLSLAPPPPKQACCPASSWWSTQPSSTRCLNGAWRARRAPRRAPRRATTAAAAARGAPAPAARPSRAQWRCS